MNPSELVQQFRDATAEPPPHARERVWRKLQAPAPASRAWAWAVPVAAALVAVVMLRPAPGPVPLVPTVGEGFVVIAPAGALVRHGSALTLQHGEALVSSSGAEIELVAGAHRVKTDAA